MCASMTMYDIDLANCITYHRCRNADQAALAIAKSFNKYNINTAGEMAAIIAVMAFESGEFRYQRNLQRHAGQGSKYLHHCA